VVQNYDLLFTGPAHWSSIQKFLSSIPTITTNCKINNKNGAYFQNVVYIKYTSLV